MQTSLCPTTHFLSGKVIDFTRGIKLVSKSTGRQMPSRTHDHLSAREKRFDESILANVRARRLFDQLILHVFSRVFLNTVDGGRPNAALDRNHNPRRSDACVTGRNAEVNPAVFAAAAGADPSVAQFLDMPTTSNAGGTVDGDEVTTLRIALRELGRSGAHAGRGWAGVGAETRIRWEDVEEVLFERYDPANIFGKPPSTVSVASSVGDAEEEVRVIASGLGLSHRQKNGMSKQDDSPRIEVVRPWVSLRLCYS